MCTRSEEMPFLPSIPAGCEVRLHAVPKVATGRSGTLAVKREEAGCERRRSAGLGPAVEESRASWRVRGRIAQGGLSKYCLHVSDVRSRVRGTSSSSNVTGDGFQESS